MGRNWSNFANTHTHTHTHASKLVVEIFEILSGRKIELDDSNMMNFMLLSRQAFAENRNYNRLRYMNYLWVVTHFKICFTTFSRSNSTYHTYIHKSINTQFTNNAEMTTGCYNCLQVHHS